MSFLKFRADRMEVGVVFLLEVSSIWKSEEGEELCELGIESRGGEDVWRMSELDDGS